MVFLRETGAALERSGMDEATGRVGAANGLAIYLFWQQGVAGVLDRVAVRRLSRQAGVKVVYAGQCAVGEAALHDANVVFRQIPYEVTR